MKLDRWLRIVSRCFLALVSCATAVFIVLPNSYEAEFAKKIYHASPAFFWLLLIALASIVGLVLWLARLWPQENQQEEIEAFSKRGTL